MQELHKKLEKFHVMVDSVYGIEQLAAAKIEGKPWGVYLKIDTGDKRGFCQTICAVMQVNFC